MWFNMLFPQILNMSLTAAVVIVFVLLVRLLLRKAPKIFSYTLWAVVLFRLLCPLSFESPVSIVPDTVAITSEQIEAVIPSVTFQTPANIENNRIAETENPDNPVYVSSDAGGNVVITFVWLFGVAAMLIYSVFSLLRLKRKLVGAVRLRENIYLVDHILTPFVIGVIRPKIYLPSTLSEREREYIVLHERTHIRRLDHIVKLLSFLALTLHWFNPLVWLAFILSGKDMEMSCDEAVMKKMDGDIRADYSASLLSLATGRKIFAGAPLAFGEGGTKSRIKNVMNYKKPAFWTIIAALSAVIVFCAALIFNPKASGGELLGANYKVTEILYEAPQYSFGYTTENAPYYCITADYCLYMRETASEAWEYVGELEPYPLTVDELTGYCRKNGYPPDNELSNIRKITDAYIIRVPDDPNNVFYFAIQTRSGDTLLTYGYEDVSERNDPDSDDTSIRWIFRLDSTLPEHGVNANFFDRSLAASVGETVDCFSYHEKPGYMIVGFLADGNGEKSDIGFAVFEFENRRYKLLDYHVYADAAVIKVHAPTDSKAYNGICFAADPAVCNASGESDGGAAYDVILSNNERLSSITRVVDGKQEATSKIDNNPSMTLFLRSNVVDGQDISYQFAYDELSNNEISGLFSYSVSDIEKIEYQDGNTGRLVPFTDETEINDIIEHLNAFRYDQIEPVEGSGWTYAVRLWFKDGSDMQRITLTPSSASIDGNHYISSEHEYFPQEWLEQYNPSPITPTSPRLSPDQAIGIGMPQLDYADDNIVIFHGDFGMFVYDLETQTIIRSLDLGPIGCDQTQGSDACEVEVSNDGEKVFMRTMETNKMYIWDLTTEPALSLSKASYDNDWPEPEELFRMVSIETAISTVDLRYSYSAADFGNGEYGYLHTTGWTLSALTYVRSSDYNMEYKLFIFDAADIEIRTIGDETLFGLQFDTESAEIKAVVRKGTDNEDEWVRGDMLAEPAKKALSQIFEMSWPTTDEGNFIKKSLNIPDYSIEIYTSAGGIELNLYGKTSESGFAATRINDEWQRYSVPVAEYDKLMELFGFKKTEQ